MPLRSFLYLTAVAMMVPSLLRAQTRIPESEGRPLLSDRPGTTEQMLMLNVDLGSGYDNDVLRTEAAADELSSPIDDRHDRLQASTFEQGVVTLRYRAGQERFHLNSDGTVAAVFYPVLDSPLMWNEGATASASYRLWRGAEALGSARASYQPYYSFLPSLPAAAPLGPPPTPVDAALVSTLPDESVSALVENHLTSTADVRLKQRLTRRFDAWVGYSDERSQSRSHFHDLVTHGGSVLVQGALGRGLALRMGYGYAVSRYGLDADTPVFRRYNADFGLTFNRSLSLSRHTTFAFATGTSAFEQSGDTHVFLTGNAALHREMGRTWAADLTYNRDVQFLETFRAPVSSHVAAAHVNGRLSRRLTLFTGAAVATGRVGFAGTDNGFVSYQTTSSFAVRLSRVLSASVDYSFVHYRYGVGAGLPELLRLHTDRQRVSITGTYRTPLFRRRGASDAAR